MNKKKVKLYCKKKKKQKKNWNHREGHLDKDPKSAAHREIEKDC